MDFFPEFEQTPAKLSIHAIALVMTRNALTWKCDGCETGQPNQLAHECLTLKRNELISAKLAHTWKCPISKRSVYKKFAWLLQAFEIRAKEVAQFFQEYPQPELEFASNRRKDWIETAIHTVKDALEKIHIRDASEDKEEQDEGEGSTDYPLILWPEHEQACFIE